MLEPQTAFCTVIAKNYLAQARVLVRSLRPHHPTVAMHVLIVDETEGYVHEGNEEFAVVRLSDLQLPSEQEFCFRYNILELCTAVRPFLLRYLLRKGYTKLLYLDSDTRAYGPLSEALDILDTSRLALTPHLASPGGAAELPQERQILLSGAYNLGFLGLSLDPQVRAFLDWWADRCEHYCIVDPPNGLFADQRWMDLAPGMMDKVHIFRHHGYNVGHWNLSQRRLHGSPLTPLVDDVPLRLFHFSGFDPSDASTLSRHCPTTIPVEPLSTIVRQYASELFELGYQTCSSWPYSHAAFKDGHPISQELRVLFRDQAPGRFADPFDIGEDSFIHWALNSAPKRPTPAAEPPLGRWSAHVLRSLWQECLAIGHAVFRRVSGRGGGVETLPPIAQTILADRPDLQQAFIKHGDLDERAFLNWLAHKGLERYQLKPSWCAAWLAKRPPAGLMQLISRAYDSYPGLKSQLPLALVEEHDAPAFLAWMESNAAKLRIAPYLEGIRQLFADRPAIQIRKIYKERPDVSKAFPEAMSWPGDPRFLNWLRHSGKREYGVSDDWVDWFSQNQAQHVCLRVHQMYRSRGDWQASHPAGLSPLGRDSFLEWLKETADPELRESVSRLAYLCAPDLASTLDELRAMLRSDSELRKKFPLALRTSRDTSALLDCLRQRAIAAGKPASGWLGRVERELQRLRLADGAATVVGYFHEQSGHGELARATARALDSVGHPYSILALNELDLGNADLRSAEGAPSGFSIVHVNPDDTPRLPAFLGAQGSIDRHRIGYWTWELGEMPRQWSHAFAPFEEIWTCSRHAAAALSIASPIPVHTVWPALPEPQVSDLSRSDFGLRPEDYAFLFIYDPASVTERKNPIGLIAAFRQAFGGDERVRLVLKVLDRPLFSHELSRVAAATDGLPVVILNQTMERPDVLALIRACDAYVSLHRAEGFGFTMAEAMLLRKPVIATYYSGNTDFMSPWNCFPVPYSLVELANKEGPYLGGALWAEPDLDAAADLMRTVYNQRDLAAHVAAKGQADVQRLLSPRACGERIVERLLAISQKVTQSS